MVVQLNKDGGDSAYRTALAIVCLRLLGSDITASLYLRSLLDNAYMGSGIWRRHPDQKEWYSDPNTFSRDQMAKVMLALFVMGAKATLGETVKAFLKRGLLHQNTQPNDTKERKPKFPDILSPGEVINFIRGYNLWVLYPLLTLLDAKFLTDLYFRKKKPWDYDSLMAIDLVYAQKKMPTLLSKIAAYFYKKTDYKDRIRNNYADANNGIAPLGELYVMTCEKYL